jgi:integrase/recombinase XerD
MAKRKEGEVSKDSILWLYSQNNEGKHPVKIRVTYQRKRKYYPVIDSNNEKLFLSQKDFDAITESPLKKLRGENRRLRELIDCSKETINQFINEATANRKKPFIFSEFERLYLGSDSNRNFLHFFKKHIEKLDRKGQAGTVRTYSSAYSAFKEFLHDKDIDPAELTVERLERFDEWLRTPKQKKDGKKSKPLNDTSVSIYMRCLRAIYNEMAVNDDYLKTIFPFSTKSNDRKYIIPTGTGQKGITLSIEDAQSFIEGKIKGEPIPENPMYRAKQMFLVSLFGNGINFKDLALLKYENITNDAITFYRQKTIKTKRGENKLTEISLTYVLKELIIEQGNPDKNKNSFVFEVFDSSKKYTPKEIDDTIRQWVKTTNKWLKRYCELNKLPIVTTYSARHTFASTANRVLPVQMISQMLGHSRITTTQTYLGRFTQDEKKKGTNEVINILKTKKA